MLKLVELGVCPPCSSSWGLVMIVTLGVMAAGYVGGGVGYAVKAQGAAPAAGIAAHPHYDRMVQLAGLVQDGTTFAAARLRGRDGGGGGNEAAAPLLDAEAEPPPAGGGQQVGAAEPSAAADPDPASSSDDDLVE